MYLPTTLKESDKRNWKTLDVILVTGDTYIDSPFIGAAVIGKVLVAAGYRVGLIAQPDVGSDRDIARLGEPRLFWGVTGGSVDSMVANYTALKKKRRSDDFTPGGQNTRRPDRAVIAYANLIRRYHKKTVPIVIGGIEASLRRVAHYDYWSNRIRRSILFDAKADYLLYGMAEASVVALATCLARGEDPTHLRGLCYKASEAPSTYAALPSFESVRADTKAFTQMFHRFYRNTDPLTANGLHQQHADRLLVQNPPAQRLAQSELDRIHELGFERDVHPFYKKQGKVTAVDTIRFSLTSHRGCYGECNFCAIAVHQGRTVQWRSKGSLLREAQTLAALDDFKGYLLDVGGPTANMYGFECNKKLKKGACRDKRCLYPGVCAQLPVTHGPQIELLHSLEKVAGIRKVFIASGLRYDLLRSDTKHQARYLRRLVRRHVSGQLKIAPEHTHVAVLAHMGKGGTDDLLWFKKHYDLENKKAGKKQFLSYYVVAAHPGCSAEEMHHVKKFFARHLKLKPEQVQIFTPTPSTYSSLMYVTQRDPFSGSKLFVETRLTGKAAQKKQIVAAPPTKKKTNHRRKNRSTRC